MIKGRRKNYQLGGSKAVTYPSDITVGDEATLAGNRLLLIDPQGQIHEDDLAEFIETHLEPDFANWWRQKEAMRHPKVEGVIRSMEVETPAAKDIQPAEIQNVTPGPQVYLVNCWRCSGQIAWRLDFGQQGACPYCGAWLRLVRK